MSCGRPHDAPIASRFEGFVSKCLFDKDLARALYAGDHDTLQAELAAWGYSKPEDVMALLKALNGLVAELGDSDMHEAITNAARTFNKDQNAGT